MRTRLLLLSLLLVPLPSCNSVHDKIPLFLFSTSKVTIDSEDVYMAWDCQDQLETMIEKKMSFPLFVYAAGCGTCEVFDLEVNNYLEQNRVIIPYIIAADYRKVTGRSISNTSYIIYKDGEIISTFDLVNDSSTFVSFMDSHFTVVDSIEIVNRSAYSNASTYFYKNYKIIPTDSETTLPYSFDPIKENGISYPLLLVDENEISDFRVFFSSIQETDINTIRFIGSDIVEMNNDSFRSFYGINKEDCSNYTIIYQDSFYAFDDFNLVQSESTSDSSSGS